MENNGTKNTVERSKNILDNLHRRLENIQLQRNENTMANRPLINLRVILFIILMEVCMHAYSDANFDSLYLKNKKIGSNAFTSHDYNPRNIKHIVIFKYKDSVTSEQKKEVIQHFLHLQQSKRLGDKLPYIVSIITGSQSSGEKASQGFEQAFIVTFQSEGDRNYFVGTPVVSDPAYYDRQHAEFKLFVGPLLAENNGVLVFDFMDNSHKNKVGHNE